MGPRDIRKSARDAARGTDGKLGWMDVFELAMQFARPKEPEIEPPPELYGDELEQWKYDSGWRKPPTDLPDTKNMSIALDGAKALQNLAMPKLTTKSVDEDEAGKKKTMVIPDPSQYLPEDTEEL